MSLELDPAELGFKRPYNVEVSQILRLRNPNSTAVAFKVKTTAPKQYCVRPNSGTIAPGHSVEVSVVLQPMREDPPPDARCKDKFLVQSVEVPADQNTPTWNNMEGSSKSSGQAQTITSIQERKIRVHYLPADGSASHVNGVSDHEDSTILTPPPTYTPQASRHIDDSSSHAESKTIERVPTGDTHADSMHVPESIPENLQEKLAEAQATIAKLQNESGLRQRKQESTTSKGLASGGVGLGVPTAQTNGLSVQTTAILCFIVFILTYFLF